MSIITFLKDVKSELAKVVWPTRQQTVQYTFVVILFSLVVSLILGAADFGLFKLFEIVLTK